MSHFPPFTMGAWAPTLGFDPGLARSKIRNGNCQLGSQKARGTRGSKRSHSVTRRRLVSAGNTAAPKTPSPLATAPPARPRLAVRGADGAGLPQGPGTAAQTGPRSAAHLCSPVLELQPEAGSC